MPSSPVPGPVAEELGRLGVRWQQLALPEATSRLPAVHAVVEEIAGETVPDLGPTVVIDQLTVVVYDACAAAQAAATPPADVSGAPVSDPPIGRSGTPPEPAPVTDPPIGRSGTPPGPAPVSDPPIGRSGTPPEPAPVTDPPIGRSGTPPGPAPVTDPPIGRSGTPDGDRSAEPGDTAYLLERLTALRRTL